MDNYNTCLGAVLADRKRTNKWLAYAYYNI